MVNLLNVVKIRVKARNPSQLQKLGGHKNRLKYEATIQNIDFWDNSDYFNL